MRSVVVIKTFFFLNTLKLLYGNVHCENSLAVVSVEYKIPEVCCHYREVMVL